jgi:hypothetical protein
VTGVPHDHPSVDTVRASVERSGAGLRVAIPESDRDRFPVEAVVTVVLDGTQRHAVVESHLTEDRLLLSGAYDTPALARDPGGSATDRLGEWIDARGREAGDSVLLDVIDEADRYGLRAPRESVTYRDRRSRDDGLASIAEDLTER